MSTNDGDPRQNDAAAPDAREAPDAPDAAASTYDRGSSLARGLLVTVVGVIVAWFVWDAIGNLVAVPPLFEQLGLGDSVPWVLLVIGVVVPPLFFSAALVVAHRQPLVRAALVLIASLGVIAVTRLSLIAAATGTLSVVG